MKQITKEIIIACLVVICIIMLFSIHSLHQQEDSLFNNYFHNAHSQVVVKEKYENKDKRITNNILNNLRHNKNSNIYSMEENKNNLTTVKPILNRFFSIYYTYNSNAEYSKIKLRELPMINPALISNKNIFGSGKDQTGGNYIDNIGLHSKFDSVNPTILDANSHHLLILADTKYDAWENKNPYATGEKWYLITYSIPSKIISNIEPIGRNINTNENQI